MLVDVLAIAVALVAAWLAERSFTKETPFDPRQIEAGGAMVNSFILMVIAALITWGVVRQLSTPASEAGLTMLVIAVGGLVVQGVNASLLYQHSHHNLNLRGLFFHTLADAASSLGLLIAALAIFYLNWLWADTAASILVVILAFVSAILLLRDSLHSLKNRDAWA
jgi:cobalt-zinc-cadmium efflux system protein